MKQELFAKWWAEIEPNLLRAAYRFGATRDTVQDLVQDIAVLALRNISRFREGKEFQRWAHARLHWLMLDRLESNRYQMMELDDSQPLPAEQEERLVIEDISKSIAKLPGRQQAVVRLLIEGHSTCAIASELGITEATVRSLLRFARRRLIRLLLEK